MVHNRALYKDALTLMYGGDYRGHFIHQGITQLKTTSKTVNRLLEPSTSSILPCFSK